MTKLAKILALIQLALLLVSCLGRSSGLPVLGIVTAAPALLVVAAGSAFVALVCDRMLDLATLGWALALGSGTVTAVGGETGPSALEVAFLNWHLWLFPVVASLVCFVARPVGSRRPVAFIVTGGAGLTLAVAASMVAHTAGSFDPATAVVVALEVALLWSLGAWWRDASARGARVATCIAGLATAVAALVSITETRADPYPLTGVGWGVFRPDGFGLVLLATTAAALCLRPRARPAPISDDALWETAPAVEPTCPEDTTRGPYR